MIDKDKMKELALAATPGPWEWWTSNSLLRLTGADGKDGAVLHAVAFSGIADVNCSPENRAYIAATHPATILELLAELDDRATTTNNERARQFIARTSHTCALMPCGACVTDVYSAYEAGRKSVLATTSTEPAKEAATPTRTELYRAAINCGHSIDKDKVVLYRDDDKEGNALSQLADRLAAASASPVPRAQGGNTCNEIGGSSPTDAGGLTDGEIDNAIELALCLAPAREAMGVARVLERCKSLASPAPSAKQEPSEEENLRRVSVQCMADCMDMVRSELIEMGIIDKSVAPTFIPEAVAAYVKRLSAPSASASPAAPGFVLVPGVPTKAMITAFADQLESACAAFFDWESGGANAYAAMLAASPAAAVAAPTADQHEAEDGLREAVSDFRKATYEFAGKHDPDDHARMMEAQKRIFTEARALVGAAPVAGSQQVPDNQAGTWLYDEQVIAIERAASGVESYGNSELAARLHDIIRDRNFTKATKFPPVAATAPAVPVPAAHSDDLAVERFAAAMKAKLAKKRAEGRGGWETPECTDEFLAELLMNHTKKGDPVDVANLAMMLHQRNVDHMDIAVLVLRSAALGFAKRVAPMFMQEQSAEGKKGFVFVPAEPTQEMCDAGRSEAGHWQNSGEPWGAMTWFRIYRAMLAAAPSLQQPKEGA